MDVLQDNVCVRFKSDNFCVFFFTLTEYFLVDKWKPMIVTKCIYVQKDVC